MRETEEEMRAKGLALVKLTEEYARTHPEFIVAMHAIEADILAGNYVRFPDDDSESEASGDA